MKTDVRFPFKIKIILANFILVLIFLTINIGVNLKKNQTEKENYLFEAIYNYSKEIQGQIQNDFQAVSTYSGMVIQIIEALEKSNLEDSTKNLPMIQGVKSFKLKDERLIQTRKYGDDFTLEDDLVSKLFTSHNSDSFYSLRDSYLWVTCRAHLKTCLFVKSKFNLALSNLDSDLSSMNFIIFDRFKRTPNNISEEFINDLQKIEIKSSLSVNEVNLNGEKYFISKTNFSLGGGDLFIFTPSSLLSTEITKIFKESMALAGILLSLSLLFSLLISSYFTKSLNILMNGVLEVSKANYEVKLETNSNDEFKLLSTTFNDMVSKIKDYIIQMQKSFRMEQEIKLAGLLQDSFIPSNGFENQAIKISGFYRPATECAGDIWGHQYFDDKLLFYIGDVTGHGLSSAFITAASSSVFRLFQDFVKNKPSILENPGEVFYYLNKVINYIGAGKLMMTSFVGIFDTKTKRLYFSNASHDYPIFLKGSEEISPIMSKTDYRLGEKTSPQFSSNEIQLSSGDKILLYTDGLVENKNNEGRNFSEGDFFRVVRKNKKQINLNTIIEPYQKNLNNNPPQDDVTVVLLEIK